MAREVSKRLEFSFFDAPCVDLAKALLGKVLVRNLDSEHRNKGRIVETECYLGTEDKACHSFNGKKTNRNEAMFMSPGTSYVYSVYGMYYCFNISSRGEGAAVLIRAIEPLEGIDLMRKCRGVRRRDKGESLKEHQICNGPSKLCQAFQIDKELINKIDLSTSELMWLEEDEESLHYSLLPVVSSRRIGIESAGPEWAQKPLRFYILQNKFVSVRNREAENKILLENA